MTIKLNKKNSDIDFALDEVIHGIIFDVLVYVVLFRSYCIGDFINSKNTFLNLQ